MPPLFARESGKGPVIIFLHGFCETHEIWEPFTTPFESEYRVVTLDLPGFGKSPLPKVPFSLEEVATIVASWIKERYPHPVLLLTHSLGGYVGLSILKNYPNLLAGIGLIHSSVFADTPEKKENRNKVIDFVARKGVEPFVETFVPGLFASPVDSHIPFVRKIALTTRPETLMAFNSAMRDRPDLSEVWRSSTIPKLVVAGSKDAVIPITASREMAGMTKRIAYCELPEAAHMGFLEAKADCQEAISGFAHLLF